MDFDIYEENALFRLKESLDSINEKDKSQQNGFSYFSVASEYRKIGCLRILIAADKEAFASSLTKSSQAWMHYLSLAKYQEKVRFSREFTCGVRFNAMIDAVVCNNMGYAKAIASCYPEKHDNEYEYEDDFLFYKFIAKMILKSDSNDEKILQSILHRWKGVLDGSDSSYFNICRSLLNQSEAEFIVSLKKIIDERKDKFEQWKRTPSYIEEVAHTNQHIYVTGLALIKLAELNGMSINEQFETIPEICKLSDAPALYPDNYWETP